MEHTDENSRWQGRSMIWRRFRTPNRTGQALILNRLGRMVLALVLASGFCLFAGSQALAEPSLIKSAYSNSNSASIEIASGYSRILIVCVDEEYDFGVASVTLDGQELTLVHEVEEDFGAGNSTSIWMMLDADLPSAGTYTVTAGGGNGKASVAAMLWTGLLQTEPGGSAKGGASIPELGHNQITTSVEAPAANSLVIGTSGHGLANGWAAPPAGWARQWDLTPNSAFHAGAAAITISAGEITLTETCGGGNFNRAAQVVAAFAPEPDPPPGCPDCRYRRSITIDPAKLGDSCAGNVAGFPVLVSLENDNLKSSGNGGHVRNSSGYDIAFTDADGIPLFHEVELWDADEGKLVAWVRVPVLSAGSNTMIYLVYGDSTVAAPTQRPGSVWDGNYRGVWHLNQAPTNSAAEILDSTANGYHGQSHAMESGDITTGRIGYALDFDGIRDDPTHSEYVNIGDPLAGASEFTLSAWIRHDGIPNLIERYVSIANNASIRHARNGKLEMFVRTATGAKAADAPNALTVGTWYYVVGTWDGQTERLYKNDAQVGSRSPGGALVGAGSSTITTGGEPMDGVIDEVRVSNIARDACWIETEYSNQSNPAAFHAIGEEEDTGAAVTPYKITAVALLHGSITPAGEVWVDEGDSAIFILEPDEGYEVDTVKINTDPPMDYNSLHYQFTNVTQNSAILVTFKAVESGSTGGDDTTTTLGCSQNITAEYPAGFDPDDLDLLNVEVEDATKYIRLNTGNVAIDTENIVLPFRQQVAVTFLYEGGNNEETDFGWMLASEDPYGSPDPHRIIYQDINDNNNNGVLDVDGDDTTDRFGDRNKDGTVDALDNREVLGTFDAGTELVFFIKIDEGQGYRNNMTNPVTGEKVTDFGKQNEQVYHYTKTAWNQSRFTSRETLSSPELSCDRAWGDPPKFTKTYNLGLADSLLACSQDDGWMDAGGLARAADPFGLHFAADDTASLSVTWDDRWPAVMVGAPADNLNAWVLGFEDLVGGGDMDNNDIIFMIERETGGTVGLKPLKAISPETTDSNITGVTIGVWDEMPDAACAGQTEITYWLSIDGGLNWVEVDGWDEVYKFNLQNGQKVLVSQVNNWTPGTPAFTYRTRRVDFTELGQLGHELLWKADLKSRKEGCEPKIIDMSLSATVDDHGYIARATPTVLANVLFGGSMETPAWNWTSAELRGHLKNTLIYHPQYPNHTFNDPAYPADPDCLDYVGWTDCPVIWDAGDVLKNQMEPSERSIYIPNVTVQAIDSASAEVLATGDGATTTFSGRLIHYPVLATTVRISDAHETFSDQHIDLLDGDLGGSGKINRFTGHYSFTFDEPPNADQPITAVYSYFTFNPGGSLREFKEDNVLATELGLDDSVAIPSGYLYDFDNDDAFSAADANWLVNWTRGYTDGNTKASEKEWTLGAIDHSVPALATPPASSPWFYGTAFPEDKQDSDQDRAGYRAFTEAQAGRRTVVYVGARDGMLHAFDAGAFRWGDNPCSTAIAENRGYFQWTDPTGTSDCSQIDDLLDTSTYCSADCQPADYGSGEELWAFIPTNLLPRLKYNYLGGTDKAYVDASPALADVYTDGAWRTVLLSAEGNGGDTIFCLDVTNPADPRFMWEFADPDLFRSRSSPAVAQIGRILYQNTTKWVAFFVSGKTFNDILYPSIYAIDIADGSLVEKIELDAEPAGAGGILSGQPTIVDSDGNGYVDRLYIGSDKGRLYKINIPDDPDSTKYRISHCVINTDYTDRDGASPVVAKQYEPIYGSPTVVSGNSVDLTGQMIYDIRIFFGTGDSPYYDEDINFADTRYSFFAYRDTAGKGICDSSAVALDWFFELPVGHRIYASAFAAAGNIYFGTSTGDTEDPCDIFANSDDAFDANAGMLYAFDLEGTKKFEKQVGNVLAAPVVEDQHIYVQSVSGEVKSFGSGQYNNSTRQGGIPQIEIHWWRELF